MNNHYNPSIISEETLKQNVNTKGFWLNLAYLAQKAGDYAEDMAMEMLATTIGLPDDLLTWDQREEQWKLSGKIYKTNNFTQSAGQLC